MDKNFKPWLKHRYIKTMYDSYVRIPENDDHLSFMVDTVGFGNESVYEVVMVDGKGRRTLLTNIGHGSSVLPTLILDEMMNFVTDDDIEVISMYLMLELARDRYDPRTDLPI